jgi:hypothetical protein
MNVKIDINEALTQIANGLGVAVDKLYPILYKQAIIEGVYNLIALIAIGLVWLFIYKVGKSFIKTAKKKFKESDDWNDTWIEYLFDKYLFQGLVGFFFCIFVVIFGVASILNVPDLMHNVTTAFFNTDYFIIKDVIKSLK